MENNIHEKKWGTSIAKYGFWYLLSSFITKGLGIILLPVYTKYLVPSDYGILQTLTSISSFLPFILSLCLDSAFGRFYHEDKVDNKRLSLLYSTVYWFVSIYGLLVLIICILSSKLWVESLIEVPVFPYVYLTFIPVLFNQLALLGRTFLQQALETRKSTALDIISTLINAGLSVLLLVYFNLGVLSRLYGIAAGSLFLFVFYFFYYRKIGLLVFRFSSPYLVKCLKFSLPMIPAMAGSWVSTMSDRLILAKYCSLATVGLYSIAFQLGQTLYLLGDAITRVVSPLIMSGLVYDKDNTKIKIANSSYQVLILMLIVNFFLFVFADEFMTVFADKAYFEAAVFIPIFGFSYVVGVQQRYPLSIISYKKKTWIISMGCILMACLNFGINILFVPVFGYSFAVWANVAANVFYTIWTFCWGQKYEKINYHLVRYLRAIAIFSFIVLCTYFIINNLTLCINSFLFKLMWTFFCSYLLMRLNGYSIQTLIHK